MTSNSPNNGNLFSVKNVVIASVALVGLSFLYNQRADNVAEQQIEPISYTTFKDKMKNGEISDVTETRDPKTGQVSFIGLSSRNDQKYKANDVANKELADVAELSGRSMGATTIEPQGMFSSMLFAMLPVLLIIGALLYINKRNAAGRGPTGGFGNSKAKLVDNTDDRVTFDDVAGIDECKEELVEIVEFLKDPKKLGSLGGRVPCGVIMAGHPGTGKTLLAKAVAGEAGVPCFQAAGSDFVEMFVGVGAARIRDMFETAKKNAPCVIFIDEIDAIGKHRGNGMSGGASDEREGTLNALLVEMDGFGSNPGVIVLAATNRIDVLDPALLRPGRFDRQVQVHLPDLNGREAILKAHCRKKPIADDVNLRDVARNTPGFSGADLANVANEAALMGARRGARQIHKIDFSKAVDKIIMGPERKSFTMTPEDLAVTAYHEAGHAIAQLFQPELKHSKLHKVSVIPRGQALGVTMTLPENDRVSLSKAEMKAEMAKLYAGRLAEEITFGPDKITTGASNDIMRATNMARTMVKEYGMGDGLPMRKYTSDDRSLFGSSLEHSTEVLLNTDAEIDRLIHEAAEKARTLIRDYSEEYELLAQGLIEFETLERDDIELLMKTKSLDALRAHFEVRRDSDVRQAGNDNHPPAVAQGQKKPNDGPLVG